MINVKSLITQVVLTLVFVLTTSCNKEPKPINYTNKTEQSQPLKTVEKYYFDQPIAHLTDENETIYFVDYNQIIQTFKQNYSISQNTSVDVSRIDIKLLNGVYLFTANTSKGRCGIELIRIEDHLYEISKTMAGASKTVTCTGCKSTGPQSAHECDATVNPGPSGGIYCTECNNGDCIKTSTMTVKSMLSDNSEVVVE